MSDGLSPHQAETEHIMVDAILAFGIGFVKRGSKVSLYDSRVGKEMAGHSYDSEQEAIKGALKLIQTVTSFSDEALRRWQQNGMLVTATHETVEMILNTPGGARWEMPEWMTKGPANTPKPSP